MEVVAATTEDVAVVGGDTVGTNDTGVDFNADTVEDVAISAAAEERAPDAATVGGGFPLVGALGGVAGGVEVDGDVRLVDVAVGLEGILGVITHATTRAVDVGVVAVVVERADDGAGDNSILVVIAANNGVVADKDVADTAMAFARVVEERVAGGDVAFHIAGGGHVAAAEYAVHDVAAVDDDVGVAVDTAGLLDGLHRAGSAHAVGIGGIEE